MPNKIHKRHELCFQDELWNKLKEVAEKRGISISQLVREACLNLLEKTK